MALIDDAYKEHIRLLKEINEKDALIRRLKEPAKLAREAVRRYCPPELQSSADKWLSTLEL